MACLVVVLSVVVAIAVLLSLSVGRFGVDFWSFGGRRAALGMGVGVGGGPSLLSERLVSSDVLGLWVSLAVL